MIRPSTLFFICVASGVGIALFHIKYQVSKLEQDYHQTQKRIKETKETIHILKAEWSHLNDPKRLQELATKYLNIVPIKSHQFISMKKLAPNEEAYDKFALDQLIAEVSNTAGES
jgi:cell division protein FtsL